MPIRFSTSAFDTTVIGGRASPHDRYSCCVGDWKWAASFCVMPFRTSYFGNTQLYGIRWAAWRKVSRGAFDIRISRFYPSTHAAYCLSPQFNDSGYGRSAQILCGNGEAPGIKRYVVQRRCRKKVRHVLHAGTAVIDDLILSIVTFSRTHAS